MDKSFLGIDVSTLPIWANVLVFIGTVFVVAKAAGWFVEGASAIGRRLGISELVLGLTVVAIGTSAPEFAVSITAAVDGSGNLAVSNVVGSNVFNLGVILGIVAMLRAIGTNRAVIVRDGGLLFLGSLFALATIGADLAFGRVEGAIFVGILMLYIVYLIRQGRRDARAVTIDAVPVVERGLPLDLVFFGGGLAVVLLASRFMVDSASTVARDLGVSEWVIGVTIVAAGTSAPELATSVVAALKGRGELGVGALIGSDIFNLFGVIGVSGLIAPMTVAPEAQVSLYALSGMVLVVILFMRTSFRISRVEGLILFLIALGRWAWDIFGSTGGQAAP